jgi:hypothetical protein
MQIVITREPGRYVARVTEDNQRVDVLIARKPMALVDALSACYPGKAQDWQCVEPRKDRRPGLRKVCAWCEPENKAPGIRTTDPMPFPPPDELLPLPGASPKHPASFSYELPKQTMVRPFA